MLRPDGVTLHYVSQDSSQATIPPACILFPNVARTFLRTLVYNGRGSVGPWYRQRKVGSGAEVSLHHRAFATGVAKKCRSIA
jgi:hypothetical protein